MTPQQRQQTIKALASGKVNEIAQLNESSVSGDNIILCFYYLLEQGRPEGYSNGLQFAKCTVTTVEDLAVLEASLNNLAQTKDYEQISLEGLTIMVECMECYRILKESKQLHCLDVYRHYLSKYEIEAG